MNRVSVGIIGAGQIVKTMHLPILYNMASVRVCYIADTEDKSTTSYAVNAQFIKLNGSSKNKLPITDAVLVGTPLGVREHYYDNPAVSQSCILTEKPFIGTLEKHEKLINQHRAIMCNYNRKFYATIGTLKKIIDNSLLGSLREVTIAESAMPRGTGKGPTHYQFNRELSGGGLLIERGCHTLSQLDVLFLDSQMELADSKIEAISGFDIDINLDLTVSCDNAAIPIRYELSAGRLFETLSNYRFDNGVIRFDHTNASSPMHIEDCSGNEYLLEPDT